MRQMTLMQSRATGHVLAGPISHNSIQCMDFVKIFYVLQGLSTIYFVQFSGC